jgi:hypothetical protein
LGLDLIPLPENKAEYAIVSQADIRDAMTKLEARQQREKAKAARVQRQQFGRDLGRIDSNRPSRRAVSFQ